MERDFGHHIPLNGIRDGDRIDLVADEAERLKIAQRLGLPSLKQLQAHATLSRDGERVRVLGRLRAILEQSCIATGDKVPEHVDEPFEILFVPEPRPGGDDEEIELGEEDCDMVFYDGLAIDLGASVADSLALAIDPYPRSGDAELALRDAGVLTEMQAGPFAVLAKLKKSGDEG